MRYAIISDIHGNYPALAAVLADAKAQGAGMFLFLGDYVNSYPYGNEVAETLQNIENAIIIRGNNEDYLRNLSGQDQRTWTRKQFAPIYWSYRSLTPENLHYLSSLPEEATVSDPGGDINLIHASAVFFRPGNRIEAFYSEVYKERMQEAPFTHEEYLEYAKDEVLSRSDVLTDICALPPGVYLFGHNHLPFHMEYEGRYFVNPGSCGQPLTGDTSAPYTLLEHTSAGWKVTERWVPYDMTELLTRLRDPQITSYPLMWRDIFERSLATGLDYMQVFVNHLRDQALLHGEETMPYSNKVLDAAIKTWEV